jgi:hypothetical protein
VYEAIIEEPPLPSIGDELLCCKLFFGGDKSPCCAQKNSEAKPKETPPKTALETALETAQSLSQSLSSILL